ncbi:Hypothetical protein BRZCDTV_346 [Brazilian cedratvirus IHUMI]|uniref:Uncharacterized protein n=1 Tax=Brazilian cedratvirus IHUMI TaxID=2126980 RepID=A0A2R8FEN5_9VIRU|nr:Hypothetical protein BRZCDTV_346 [Brazilian cedratvirus IHUMI]
MAELRIIPTFHLRGIVPAQVLKRYKEGSFPVFPENKVNVSVTNIRVLPKLSSDNSEENFIFVDKSGTKNVYTTTNHASFQTWKERKCISPEAPCAWCRHPVGEKGMSMPICTMGENLYVGDVPTCNYNCCYSELKRQLGTSFLNRDPLYKDAESTLKYLFYYDHPEGKLRGAPDWRLLNINGGPLTYEEFSQGAKYSRSINTIVPIKVCYSKN